MDIAAAIASLGLAKDFATLVISAKKDSELTAKAIEFQGAIIELQNLIMSLQAEHHALQQEKIDIEKKLADFESWEAEEKRYDLLEISQGVFVYSYKEDSDSNQPMHWLCPNCFQEKRKSLLQLDFRGQSGTCYLCPNCNTKITDHGNRSRTPKVIR